LDHYTDIPVGSLHWDSC